MMSVAARTAGGAVDYYIHLQADNHREENAREDYYAREGAGYWRGAYAARLELVGEVRRDDFAALARGYSPTGEALVQNAGDKDRVALYDCTFSAPKSVSNVWGIGDAETRGAIGQAHEEAVRETLDEMQERFCLTRRGKEGAAGQERVEIAVALWQHGTSRELDEDLHTHATFMNLGMRADGTTGTLDGRQFFEWQKVCGALYRVRLEQKLRTRGFETERDGEAFRLKAVPRSLEVASSQARNRILQVMAERGVSGAKAAEVVNLDTRKSKQVVPVEELRQEWRARGLEHGFAIEQARAHDAPIPAREQDLPGVAQVLETVTEHKAVLKAKELEYAALVAAMGTGIGREKANDYFAAAKAAAVTLENDKGELHYSTHELVEIERDILAQARARAGEAFHQLDHRKVEQAITDFEQRRGFALSAEQRQAVEHLTATSGGVKVLVGDAGTGKSTTMEAVKNAYEHAHYRVLGCAPSGKAAAELQAGTGIPSRTIHSLLNAVERGQETLDGKTVLVVDEAAMVDSRLMHRLSTAAHAAGAKLIECGDQKQIQPVGPGAHFKHQAEQLGHARLIEVRRQREEWRKEAVQQMSQGEAAKAMQTYIERGLVEIKTTHKQAVRACVKDYLTARAEHGEKGVAIMATTNKVVNDLNTQARTELKAHGALKDARTYRLGERKIELAAGERVLMTRNDYRAGRDIRNGDLATVTQLHKDGITVRLDRERREVKIDLREYQDVKHGYALTAHKMQGSTIERGVVYANAQHMSRELAYVMDSRARENTKWVFTAHQVEKLAEQSGVERSEARTQLDRLQEAAKAMSQSRQAESTLDYRVTNDREQPRTPEHTPAMRREHGQELSL
jgi:Ti-type conjugative transfer relaxase TraA